ncbi:aminotransferase class V-fold PLP-dependent enzyme [Streptomyces yaizuensis]|uniref:Aminotransferase class V-fold PLP-dependent enzyme n=1 Tax=Streptomyces yaizuensis TaxID=2989713 RepID=A0ABQ5P2N7_9ACTN|nr:aminotransferase class V-fold PLP-dependent enzyme [Streptomyces sp. YSPA8]GLF96872.1 aminotransferase class V-fold PLP-dependent enzyme [Streptomyces sp. YSPA8]
MSIDTTAAGAPAHGTPGADWDWARRQFDLDPDYVHLALSLLAPHPRPVREAIARHRGLLDRNPALHFHRRDEQVRRVLERAGAHLGAEPDTIALTESTTAGLAVVITGLRLAPGDEILSTVHEHYAARELIRFKAAADGASHRTLRLYDDPARADADAIVDAVVRGIGAATRLLVLTWVHSGTGVKLPLARIGAAVARVNAGRPPGREVLICVDAVHALGVEDFGVTGLGCDFLVAGCHKWLFGPRGTGVVWGSARGWSAVRPIVTSFDVEVFWPWYLGRDPDAEAPAARRCSPGGFPAFEHRWALAEAFDFQLTLGKARVAERIAELTGYCRERLAGLDGVVVRTPADPALRAGIVCFDAVGRDPAEVVAALEQERIMAGQTPYRDSAVRFSPGVLNSAGDIDRAVGALAGILRTAPGRSGAH